MVAKLLRLRTNNSRDQLQPSHKRSRKACRQSLSDPAITPRLRSRTKERTVSMNSKSLRCNAVASQRLKADSNKNRSKPSERKSSRKCGTNAVSSNQNLRKVTTSKRSRRTPVLTSSRRCSTRTLAKTIDPHPRSLRPLRPALSCLTTSKIC